MIAVGIARLPDGRVTPENVRPRAKNPIIAGFFREIGRADRLGSGVRNLYKYSKNYGGADHVFTEGNNFVISVSLKKLDPIRFPFEKPHIGEGKQPIGGEKQPIETKKPHIGDEKPHIGACPRRVSSESKAGSVVQIATLLADQQEPARKDWEKVLRPFKRREPWL